MGQYAGKEVVQVYVRDKVSSIMTPVKMLKGFQKKLLLPGEKKNFEILIPVKELYLTDNQGNRYLESGEFEIMVGSSSEHIHGKLSIYAGNYTRRKKQAIINDKLSQSGRKIVTVCGTIRDIQATPISGVQIKAGDKVTYTDKKGTYIIKIKENSYVKFYKEGYQEQVIHVNGNSDINLRLIRE